MKIFFLLIVTLLITSCAGRITAIEYQYSPAVGISVPMKTTDVYFYFAPSPIDARPPVFENINTVKSCELGTHNG